MARPTSSGLDYVYLDRNFFNDRKVKKLQRTCGKEAPYLYLALLTLIAAEGYYIRFDDDMVFDLSDMTGFSEDRVRMMLTTCCEVGLLNKELMQKEHVLTSHGIQKNYEGARIRLKRRSGVREYSLLSMDDDVEETVNIRERLEIVHTFFMRNYLAPEKEYDKMIGYNDDTHQGGWESMTGPSRRNAVEAWRQRDHAGNIITTPRFPKPFLKFWDTLYKFVKTSEDGSCALLQDMLSDRIAFVHNDDLYGKGVKPDHLSVSSRLREYLKEHWAEGGFEKKYAAAFPGAQIMITAYADG